MEKFIPINQLRPLQSETNLSILKHISVKEVDSKTAISAFNEFYFRFYRYVWNVAYRVCSKFSKDTTIAEDLFQEVFKRVYLKVGLLIKGKEDQVSDITIKAWLGRIANNVLMDYIRNNNVENKSMEFIVDVHGGLNFQNTDIQEIASNINQIKLQEAIQNLNAKERDILYLYIYCTENKVNSKDLQILADKYNVGKETIPKPIID